MRFPNHVSTANDWSMMFDWGPVVVSLHPFIDMATGVPSPVMPHGEMAVRMGWPPGHVVGKNKFSTTVFHRGLWIALEGHDCGPLIAHLLPFNDAMNVVHGLGSSRKSAFFAAEVKANGKPIGCNTFFDTGIVPTPMLTCAIAPIPNTGTGMALTNSVLVGMHWWNLLTCWVEVYVEVVTSMLMFFGGGAKPPTAGDQSVLGWLGEEFKPKMGAPSSIIGGLMRMAGQEWLGFRGDAEVATNLGVGGAAGFKLGISRSGEDGRMTAQIEGRIGPESFGNLRGSSAVQWGGEPGPDGRPRPTQVDGSVGAGLAGYGVDYRASTNRPEGSRGDGGGARGGYWHVQYPDASGEGATLDEARDHADQNLQHTRYSPKPENLEKL